MFWPSFAIYAALIALFAVPAHAQGTSAIQQGLSTQQDNTNVAEKVVQLRAQLDAIERETLRRLKCQANPDEYGVIMVSTETGCQEVPGLRAFVASQVVSTTAPCSLPWGGSILNTQSITAYQAPTVAYGQSCNGQTRTCNNGTLSGAYLYNSCAADTNPYSACVDTDTIGITYGMHYLLCPAPVPAKTCAYWPYGAVYGNPDKNYLCY